MWWLHDVARRSGRQGLCFLCVSEARPHFIVSRFQNTFQLPRTIAHHLVINSKTRRAKSKNSGIFKNVITFARTAPAHSLSSLRPEVEGEGVRDLYNDFGVARDVSGHPTMATHHASIDCTGCTGFVQACTGLYRFREICPRSST